MKNKSYLLIIAVFVCFSFSNCSRTNSQQITNQTEKPVRGKPAPVAEAEPTKSIAIRRAPSNGELRPEVKAIKDRKVQNNGIPLKSNMKLEHKKPKKGN